MRKRVALGIVFVLIMCMCGCSQEGMTWGTANITNSGNADATQVVDVPDESGEPDEPMQPATTNYLDVSKERIYDGLFEDVSLMSGYYDKICLNTTEYPALTAAVDTYNRDYESIMNSCISDLKTWASNDYKESGADHFFGPYTVEEDTYITRADAQVLSLAVQGYLYSGGAHGSTGFATANFDVKTGKTLTLEDVFTDTNGLPNALATELLLAYPELKECEGMFWDGKTYAQVFEGYLTPSAEESSATLRWTVGYEGVTFYFGSYELAAYAYGVQVVTIPYAKYPSLLNSEYFTNVSSDYVLELMNGYGESDIDGNGETDSVRIGMNYNYEYDYGESFDVTVNGNTFTQEAYYYKLDSYLVKSGNQAYVYVNTYAESDYRSFYVYRITSTSVEYVGNFEGFIPSFTNSLDYTVAKRCDMLSTYTVAAECYTDSNGMPCERDGVYEVMYEAPVIKSTVAITAEIVDENGTLTGASETFPAGTAFTIRKTDGSTYVDVQTGNGTWCRFYTTEAWPPTVNGMNAEESFEMLWYAG